MAPRKRLLPLTLPDDRSCAARIVTNASEMERRKGECAEERRGLTDSSYAFSAMVAASSAHPFFVALSAFSLVSPLLKRPYFEGGSTSTTRIIRYKKHPISNIVKILRFLRNKL